MSINLVYKKIARRLYVMLLIYILITTAELSSAGEPNLQAYFWLELYNLEHLASFVLIILLDR